MTFLVHLVASAASLAVRLVPEDAPLQRVACGSEHTLNVRVPDTDMLMEAMVARAHRMALEAGEDRYDEVMEENMRAHWSERPSYWAQLWPSATLLTRELLAEPALVRDGAVLELGAGLGLCSVGAAMAGAGSVLATDLEEDALLFTRANAEANGVAVETSTLDWASGAVASLRSGGFDCVLGSDVLYDEQAPALIAGLLRAAVRDGGLAVLTDNTQRPYGDARRAELLRLLCDASPAGGGGGGGGFVLDRRERSVVELRSAGAERHEVELLVLRRGGAESSA